MLKHLMIIAALVTGFSVARANTLDEEFRRICSQTGVESQDLPVEASGFPVDNVDKFVMAQFDADNSDAAQKAIGLIPDSMLWMAVEENGGGISLYGEELADENIALLMLILQDGTPMLMYLEGDKELARQIRF